jgi:hypothetical protein
VTQIVLFATIIRQNVLNAKVSRAKNIQDNWIQNAVVLGDILILELKIVNVNIYLLKKIK